MELIIYIVLLIVVLYITAKADRAYHKNIAKEIIMEYEEERRRREDAKQALLELDELEKELNEKSRE